MDKMGDYVQKNIETYKVMKSFFSLTFSHSKQSIFEQQKLDDFLSHLKPSANILDLACGIGKITRYIAQKGFYVEGCDLCENLLNVAKEKNANINYFLCDIRYFKTNKKYEAIILSYILFHFKEKDIELILRNVREMLKKSGIVHIVIYIGKKFNGFIEDPINNDKSIINFVKKERKGKKFLTYVHLMEADEVIEKVTSLGYKVLSQSILHTEKGIGFSEKILFLDIQKN